MKEPIMRKPNFFIVGAPKSGTTALNEYLKQHSEIFIPRGKEFHFFGSDLKKSKKKYIHDINKYLSFFSAARDEKRIGENSVMYLYSKMAPRDIKEFNSSAKIIMMLRDPVDMLYSFHSQLLYGGFEDIVDFQVALHAEEERKRGLRIPKGAFLQDALFYHDVARYAEQVQRYFEVFGHENVHVIIFDDFKTDTAGSFRKTLRFLDVNEDFEPNYKIINPNKRARSRFVTNLYNNPPYMELWPDSTLLPRLLRNKAAKILRRVNTIYGPRSPMDPDLKKRLKSEFKPEADRLSELLGRDLSHWSK
jgi:hypothetical protein